MVASRLRGVKTAFQIRQRATQYRSTVCGPFETGTGLVRSLMALRCARIVFRNRLLVVAQYVNSEPFPRVQVAVRPRSLIHANQNQHRIERNRTKCVRSHSMHFASFIHGDDRNSGGKASHGLTKIAGRNIHAENLASINTPGERGKSPARSSDSSTRLSAEQTESGAG